jgi:ABC-type branched-subunit amino acid transport system ATPase component
MGLWKPSRGKVTFAGRDIGGWATPDISRAGIAYVPESMGVFADLTVQENMILAAQGGTARLRAARLDLRLLSGSQALLDASCRRAVGRAEADAVDRARHHRAAHG